MKKRVVIIFICIIVVIFILINYMVVNNSNYYSELEKIVISNTNIKNIEYINEYDNYLIVKDSEYLYLITSEYDILLEVDISLVDENKNGYDIIYQDEKLMYFNDYYKDNKLVYEYYDIYSYELIDRVFVGG